MTQPAVTVPAGPTSCARRRLAREGSAYPARRGAHTLHTVSLFRPSPKVAMNPLISEGHKSFILNDLQETNFILPYETSSGEGFIFSCLWASIMAPATFAPPYYSTARRGGLRGAGGSSTDCKIAANIERGF